MEIDHVFICVRDHQQAADAMKSLGLSEGTPNVHPGQGTANRRFFFHNAFIELLHLTDEAQAQSPLTAPTRLFERLTCTDGVVSPFGICFRPCADHQAPTFTTWDYRPTYLPAGLKVDVGTACVSEPMWFFLSFAKRPDQAPAARAQPLEHRNEFHEITSVNVSSPHCHGASTAANSANLVDGFKLTQGEEHLITLEIDHGLHHRTHDFRPLLPMIINW
ncbi:VOC family protein [Pseudomonas kulmbachensis]|uniref:VOC family protein n=1 Tax=Pseudomonas kulmbachensis TaxID=3043408 RepID=UPI002AAFC38C|nr:VOC family protein [Pseudomonas sp. FLM 004-28]